MLEMQETSIPGSGRFPGGGNGNPLQHSCLKKPHGQRSPVGYSPWGRKELDMTERLSTHTVQYFPNGRHIISNRFTKWRNDWIPSRLARSFLKRIPGMGLSSWVMTRFKPVSDCPPSLSPLELQAQLKTNTPSWGPTLIHLWAEFGLPDASFWNPLSRILEVKWRSISNPV